MKTASVRPRLHYLGPEGSFTHAAALENSERFSQRFGKDFVLVPEHTANDVFAAVRTDSTDDFGILAFENNVEGYVVPNLDALIDADDVVGIDRVGIPVVFDAFVRPDHAAKLTHVAAHPHGLAQCRGFIDDGGYEQVPAASNAAACKNLTNDQIGLGPRICGKLYGLDTLQPEVQDYKGARTEFLLLASRKTAQHYLDEAQDEGGYQFETVFAFIPLSTGPGVIANALDILRDTGLNMTSLISRPIKGHDGTYSFIVTVDAAPWEQRFVHAITPLLNDGDWVRTLAVYERPDHVSPPVETWMLPTGGVRSPQENDADREILWRGRSKNGQGADTRTHEGAMNERS
ncbi:MAG: chorismate mutase [Bifidobacteriaceae bacterium]|jgi:chorismate mutase/prephenate dehydratase|nr:chorismate mutase [Bifidobacteriaceae bacterium]